ncbi:MAG: glycoside hydrolase family 2 TIM barrel-domain containing protein [Planctomycetota bacterium]
MRCLPFVFLWCFTSTAPAQQTENTVPLTEGLAPLSVLNAPVELPGVRLTPPVTAVGGLNNFTIDLSGTWDFAYERPIPFTGKAEQVQKWDTIELPGHFAFQGYEPLKNELGRAVVYRKTFDVPAQWADHAVMLRFGSIDGLAKLWVNERPVGSSNSAFLPVEFDVSPYIVPGEENEIAVTVEVSDLTAWYLRELGGMGRAVTLTALPTTHISRLHVVLAEPTENGNGVLWVEGLLTNIGRQPGAEGGLVFSLVGPDGRAVALPQAEKSHPIVDAGATQYFAFSFAVSDIEPWTNESPALYELRAHLTEAGEQAPRLAVARPFGFRKIEIDGHQLLVNGRPVQLAGANYHVTHPGYGHFVPGQLIRKDLEILKNANLNALRAWPTPYREYVDACNELGLFTTIEVPVNLQLYAPGPRKDHGNNPALDRPYLELAARVVETYRSDPSVLMWGLANESIYYDYFQRAAVAMRKADPTRPVFFGGDGRMGVDIPGVQINDEHYPRGGTTTWADPGHIVGDERHGDRHGWQFPTDKPAISSEWLHLNINNRAQLLLDPGVDDFWGLYAKAHQDWTWRTPYFVGGFTFLAAPYRGLESKTQWRGFFDDHRRPTPYLWHMHKASSPIQLDRSSIERDAENGDVRFTLTNRFNFTDFADVEFVATQGQASHPVELDAPPHTDAEAAVRWDPAGPTLTLTATGADGREIDRFVLVDNAPALPAVAPDAAPAIILKPPYRIDLPWAIRTGDAEWHIDTETGLITRLVYDDEALAVAGPRLTVRGHGHPNKNGNTPNISELCRDWKLKKLKVEEQGDTVVAVATGKYNHAVGTLTTTFHPGDRVTVAYDFEWTWDTEKPFGLFDYGIAFTVPPAFDTLTWSRNALWSAYPADHVGRAHGSAPATGEPRWAEARDSASADGTPAWPWSQDLTGPKSSDGRVTRDFRATRIHFRHGGLVGSDGTGLFAVSDTTQHLRALPAADTTGVDHGPDNTEGFTLQVNDYFEGGSDYHSTKSLYVERRNLQKGARLTGTSEWRWISTDD